MFHGHVDAVCREMDGSVAWEVHQPNLITDYGRSVLANGTFYIMRVVTSPATEDADVWRTAFTDDGAAASSQQSTNVTPTYDSFSLTKTWAPVSAFAAPASNRRIGIIGLTDSAKLAGMISRLTAYTRITPVRTQTPTQTLEVVYKITLTPLY